MPTYPSEPGPFKFEVVPEWKTIVTNLGGSNEQRKQKWSFPKYNVNIKYDFSLLDEDDMQILWDFYMARKGSYQVFYVYDFYNTYYHYSQYVGFGNAATTIFDLPGKTTAAQKIYIDNVEQTVTEDYSILTGGGASDSDRVSFVSAPSVGEVISCDFNGYLRIHCRYAEDKMTRDTLLGVAFSIGISLKGLGL